MGLSKENMIKYKRLGNYIEPVDERNINLEIKLSQGINNKKYFQDPKQVAENSKADKIVRTGYFAYNRATTRNGEKISIAYREGPDCTVSSAYQVFRIKDENILSPKYLMMWFNRPEFDRYARYKSHGSAHEFFDYEDMSEVYLPVPSIEVQRKYVDVYLALQKNLEAYQSKVDELKLVCDGYIEELRRNYNNFHPNRMVSIGEYISKRNEINSDGTIELEQGINIQKQFITPQRANSNLYGRRIVRKGDIAYCTQLNNSNVAVAYREGDDCVVSSVYDIIFVKDESILLSKYLMLWLIRPEFGRFVYTRSTGSAYEFLSYDDLADYKIPLPNIAIQQDIVNIYDCYIERQRIAEKLKEQLNNLCPILIKGSLETDN